MKNQLDIFVFFTLCVELCSYVGFPTSLVSEQVFYPSLDFGIYFFFSYFCFPIQSYNLILVPSYHGVNIRDRFVFQDIIQSNIRTIH